jgi:L-iditol 2-dehydrogenase
VKNLRRIIIPNPGKLKLIHVVEPEVLPRTVKVKVTACGVCGSDISQWQGHRDDRYFGHEFTGIVTEVGEGVHDLQIGTRVASGMIKACGICWNCVNGHPNYCKNLSEVLFPGGFADYTIVTHSESYKYLSPLPDSIDDVFGTLHEPVSCALRLVEFANLVPGQNVVVFGLGAIGAITAEILKGLGADRVIGIDLNPNRLQEAQKLNMDKAINRLDGDWLEQVGDEVGSRGADIVIEASGSPTALSDAFKVARIGARVIVGSVYHHFANDFDLSPIMRKELTVVGAKGSYPYMTSTEQSVAMKMMMSGHISLHKWIGLYTPKTAEQAFQYSVEGRYMKTVIKF